MKNFPDSAKNFNIVKRGKTLTVRVADGEAEVLDRLLAQAAEKWDAPGEAKPVPVKMPVAHKTPRRAAKQPERIASLGKPAPLPPAQETDRPIRQAIPVKQAVESEGGGVLDPLPAAVRMLTMLSLVLGIMFVLFYVFKKFVLKNTLFGGNEKLVRVLGTGFLGPKKNIALVEDRRRSSGARHLQRQHLAAVEHPR